MQFIKAFASAAIALASFASATNSVQFRNQDNTTRHIVFTSEADLNMAQMPELVIEGMQTKNQSFEDGWIGNFYSYNEGSENVPGYLGELRFGGWNGLNFFDVSAIVNPTDTEGVKVIYPLGMNMTAPDTPMSGCLRTKTVCLNQYNAPDDIATKATELTNFVCLLGNKATTRETRRSAAELFPRSFVLGVDDA